MSIVGRTWLDSFSQTSSESPLTKRKEKRKSFSKITLLNSSATTSCNATSPLTIPCRHHLIPLSFLPPSLQSLFTSLSAYFTDKGISFLPLSSALRRAHERYSVCVCWRGGRGRWFFFLSIFRSVTCSQPSSFFFFIPSFVFAVAKLRFSLYSSSSSSFDVDNRSGFPITMSIVLVSWRLKLVPGTNWKVWRGKWSVPFHKSTGDKGLIACPAVTQDFSDCCWREPNLFSPFFLRAPSQDCINICFDW